MAALPSALRLIASCEKSTPPRSSPMGGMMMSSTSDVTTVPRATAMMTPMASASALVLSRNARKSDSMLPSLVPGSPVAGWYCRRHPVNALGSEDARPMDQAFRDAMSAGYAFDEPSLVLGSAMHGGALLNEPRVALPLSMANRHGLIAGATGTGKTKTLQLMAGELSKAGVPVFISDIKGDVTGIAVPGDVANAKVIERAQVLELDFLPSGHPAEFLSLSGKLGAQ